MTASIGKHLFKCKNPKCRRIVKVAGGWRKIYCSEKCRTRHNSLKRYNRIKNTKEYKDYQRGNFRKWKEENREHFNDLLREPNKLRKRKLFKIRKEKGLCSWCGGKRDDKRWVLCRECRRKSRTYDRKRRKSNF